MKDWYMNIKTGGISIVCLQRLKDFRCSKHFIQYKEKYVTCFGYLVYLHLQEKIDIGTTVP